MAAAKLQRRGTSGGLGGSGSGNVLPRLASRTASSASNGTGTSSAASSSSDLLRVGSRNILDSPATPVDRKLARAASGSAAHGGGTPAASVAAAVSTTLRWALGVVVTGAVLAWLLNGSYGWPSWLAWPGGGSGGAAGRAGAGFPTTPAGGRQPLAWLDWLGGVEDVPIVDWATLAAPAEEIVAAARPVRIVNSPAEDWPARGKWTPEYVAGKLAGRKELADVIVSRAPQIVYYDSNKPLKTLPGFPLRLPVHERRAVAVATFFATIANASDPTYMYWVGQKQRRNLFRWMEADLAPTAPFWAGTPDGHTPNVQTWVGKSGLTSVVHYDAAHNFYVQLYGTKTFAIFTPAEAPHFQICPFMHPGDGHSCLDWPTLEHAAAVGDRRLCPAGWANVTARVVVLNAGDVLYLPPYWLHHVVTTGAGEAMSVSLITESEPQALMRQVETYPLAFEIGWSRRKRVVAVVSLFHHLLTALGVRKTAGPAQLLAARYAGWMRSPEAANAAKALVSDFRCSAPNPAIEAIVAQAGRDLAAVFGRLHNPGVLQLLLFNYLEAMAHWAVREPALTPVFLRLMVQQCP